MFGKWGRGVEEHSTGQVWGLLLLVIGRIVCRADVRILTVAVSSITPESPSWARAGTASSRVAQRIARRTAGCSIKVIVKVAGNEP